LNSAGVDTDAGDNMNRKTCRVTTQFILDMGRKKILRGNRQEGAKNIWV